MEPGKKTKKKTAQRTTQKQTAQKQTARKQTAQKRTVRRSASAQRAHIRRLRMEQHLEQQQAMAPKGLPMWGKTLLGVAVVLVLMLVLFRVDEFSVSGNVRYTAQEVADASGVTEGDVLMGVSKTQAASRILVKLPYVEQVEVSKALPGTLRFTVRECQATVAAQSEFGGNWLLSREGKLLEQLEDDPVLPLIRGAVLELPTPGDQAEFDDQERGALAMELAQEIEDADLSGQITLVDVTDMDQVYLIYQDRLEVQLGDGSDGAYKLAYLKLALQELDDAVRGTLDLSFASGSQAVFHPVV
jgi:cell division protein FtsQ